MKMTSKLLYSATFFLHALFADSLFSTRSIPYNADADWAIIGAGPAGIIVLGILLDLGTDPQKIVWVDPKFNVGRMGEYYKNVPGNAKTKQFIEFINLCQTFQNANSPAVAKLYELDQETEYPLKVIVDPLTDISHYLCGLVRCTKGSLCALNFSNNLWNVGTSTNCFTAAHVILATGSHPKKLDYDCKHEIPLDFALDRDNLAGQVSSKDTVAVVGSGQSAILLLKHLSELSTGRIINFYRNPISFDENIETSLKGTTARWAHDVLLKAPPANLLRLFNSCDALKAWLPICTKIIYAVGFERNEIPIATNNIANINFDDNNGIIGPRLFGIGIAFPEKYQNEKGDTISRIGLLSFMEYAQEILPLWMATKYPLSRFTSFDDLLDIEIL